jgi:hypothetical protein
MFQIPQIQVYNVEEKTENRFDVEVPDRYNIRSVSFIYLFNFMQF